MPKRYSKAMHERIKKITTEIFQDSVRNVLNLKNESPHDLQVAMDFIRTTSSYNTHISDVYTPDEIDKMRIAKEAVDSLYLQRVIALPTKSLEEILFLHEQNKIRRANKTLECIISEITRRGLLSDTSESDYNKPNGELDEPRTKTSKDSKRAGRKRCETVKS